MASESQENYINGVLEDEEDADDDGHGHGHGNDQFSYLLLLPEKGSLWDLFRYAMLGDIDNGAQFLESSEQEMVASVAQELRWGMVVIIVIRKVAARFGKSMNWSGYVVDFVLNLLSLNGNLFGLLCNLLHGTVVVPQRGTANFISVVGHLDGRIDLSKKGESLVEEIFASANSEETSMKSQKEKNPALMELSIMTAKLAYENAEVISKIVIDHWKMHFVDFYYCWNDFRKEMKTQVFILRDKPKDANLILISFRGRDPFYADDWSTDMDYSWYENPKFGRLNMGLLEALGLGNRTSPVTFHNHLQKRDRYKRPLEGTKALSSNSEVTITAPNEKYPTETIAMSAYYAVRTKLKSLLEDHKNAKFAVTGHSLGGALASLFTSVLVLHGEMNVMQRLLGVYTFAQLRIGDCQLGRYVEAHLINPVPKYFRVVYCNDFLPRLPYDERNCFYKHFGVCLYYDSLYIEQKMEEEGPNRNYFGMRHLMAEILNAAWELMRSLTMGYIYGPDYAEGWFSILARITGLVFPRMTAHSLSDYINSVRLGKERIIQVSSS